MNKICSALLVRGKKMRYARLRAGESQLPIISDFRDRLDRNFQIIDIWVSDMLAS
jgi:hypothetical protein